MATTIEEQQPTAPGEGLVQELLWVHGIIRRDLETVRRLADEVMTGAPPEEITVEVARLESNSPLWRMKVNCLYYCRLVHHHHTLEDQALFPALRSANPALNPVVDRLEADHRRVADHCDEVTTAARALAREDTIPGRQRIVDALRNLDNHLLAHLSYEEEQIAPTLRTWDGWPRS